MCICVYVCIYIYIYIYILILHIHAVCQSTQTLQMTNGPSGQFWTLEQQASLFPAEISDDSPFKQETATSVLDPDTENRTQEAIDLYFSEHHRISSPDVPPPPPIIRLLSTASAPGGLDLNSSSSVSGGRGSRPGSPPLQRDSRIGSPHSHRMTSSLSRNSTDSLRHKAPVCQWAQTELSLPPSLPPSLEAELAKYVRQPNPPCAHASIPCHVPRRTFNVAGTSLSRTGKIASQRLSRLVWCRRRCHPFRSERTSSSRAIYPIRP